MTFIFIFVKTIGTFLKDSSKLKNIPIASDKDLSYVNSALIF